MTESGGGTLWVIRRWLAHPPVVHHCPDRDDPMSWDFTEDAAFLALVQAFQESGETSVLEFLANGEGADHFRELTQNAAGEGVDLSDSDDLDAFQEEVIEALEEVGAQA